MREVQIALPERKKVYFMVNSISHEWEIEFIDEEVDSKYRSDIVNLIGKNLSRNRATDHIWIDRNYQKRIVGKYNFYWFSCIEVGAFLENILAVFFDKVNIFVITSQPDLLKLRHIGLKPCCDTPDNRDTPDMYLVETFVVN